MVFRQLIKLREDLVQERHLFEVVQARREGGEVVDGDEHDRDVIKRVGDRTVGIEISE